jgi:hypothetical protein
LQLNAPGQYRSEGLRAFVADLVIVQIQRFQWGLEKPNA